MQRMKLHLSGVKVPKLGSLHDRIYREYLIKEAQLEAKKAEMLMLMVLTNPSIEDPNKRRDWVKSVQEIWTKYLSLLLNVEIPEHTQKELEMMDYYQNVVKPAKLNIFKDKTGKLTVTGVSQVLKAS